ncbi:Hypothetical predicted protein [Pelobates cultripes]|uniref:Uncharacterized protein n=1 Tax=Pelobates cultripes TaxID=61616 RepID=A0AAD1QZ38_PELCU|nr:Hypothetical predicted protein [Pelobates cultripes]
MNKARERPTWPYMGAQVALYHDLSPMTLDARRALWSVTAMLRERGIPYKWGFPFALLARAQDGWISARHPDDVLSLLEGQGLPPMLVCNWIMESLGPRPRPQRMPRRRRGATPPGPPPRRRPDHRDPGE